MSVSLTGKSRLAAPTPRPLLTLSAALFVLTAPATAQTQGTDQFEVAVAIDEETGGLFESAFSSAFRNIGDVSVVTAAESPDFVLTGVVMCQPEQTRCRDATNYTVSLRFQEPLSQGDLHSALTMAGAIEDSRRVQSGEMNYGAEIESATDYLSGYVNIQGSWVAAWGRDVYQRAVRELVAQIDSQCFEPRRIMNRAVAAYAKGDTAEGRNLVDRWSDESDSSMC